MPIDIVMPKLDKIMDRGTIVEWLRQDGQSVKKDEPIATIETAKFTAELPSPASGTLMRIHEPGYVAEVGEVVGIIYPAGEAIPSLRPTKTIQTTAGQNQPKESQMLEPSAQPVQIKPEVRATPSAKRLARELNISLESVKSSGAGGLISREDVLAARPAEQAIGVKEETIPLLGWRKTMAERMSDSRHTAADVTTVAEVDMTDLGRLKDEVAASQKESSIKVTLTSFIIKAVAAALQEFPIVNSSLAGDKIVVKKYYNIGLAVAREGKGLIVPVIHNVEKMDLFDISRREAEILEKVKSDALSFDDLKDGTFTITNVGMFGTILNTPIIYQPQSAILGVGAIMKKPVVVDNEIRIRSMMYLSLSYDHRVIDGLPAIRFLQKVRELLENPRTLLPAT
jgi:pyruvate/2-oxoglutarate dehydrogenase complex dihydrolipoamide acyltransferase (E2) component